MTIEKSVIKLAEKYLDENNEWYSWRKINESNIPGNIKLPEGNQYKKNIVLKEKLHLKWKTEKNINIKGNLIEYYIKTWGGIKGNGVDSMNEYRTFKSEELIEKGVKGVASWSKALVVHNPNQFAVFDARVSVSLNYLQIINNVENKILFPVLASQNKRIIKANSSLKKKSKIEKWELANEKTFYNDYLDLLKKVAKRFDSSISTVEMLLFANAENIIEESDNLN